MKKNPPYVDQSTTQRREQPFAWYEAAHHELFLNYPANNAAWPTILSSFLSVIANFETFVWHQYCAIQSLEEVITGSDKHSRSAKSHPSPSRETLLLSPASINSAFVALAGTAPLHKEECEQLSQIWMLKATLRDAQRLGYDEVRLRFASGQHTPKNRLLDSIIHEPRAAWSEIADELFGFAVAITRSSSNAVHAKAVAHPETNCADAAVRLMTGRFGRLD